MYALVAMSPALGPRLHRSEIDQAACDARRAAIQRREPVPAIELGGKPVCATGRTAPGMINATGWSMEALATAVSPFVNRVVSDRTQLVGLYDFDLKWTPDTLPRLPAGAPTDQPFTFNGVPIDPKVMIEPPDPDELELEPGHPGLGDSAYVQRRKSKQGE